MPQMSPVIEAHALRKEYGAKVAVAGLTLTVERGEVFGFLGPNGAGKTTAVKMLLGLARPTSGEGSLLGVPITDPRCRRQVGFLPEHFRFHEWLRADEFLDRGSQRQHLAQHAPQRHCQQRDERDEHGIAGDAGADQAQRSGSAQAQRARGRRAARAHALEDDDQTERCDAKVLGRDQQRAGERPGPLTAGLGPQ